MMVTKKSGKRSALFPLPFHSGPVFAQCSRARISLDGPYMTEGLRNLEIKRTNFLEHACKTRDLVGATRSVQIQGKDNRRKHI